MTINLNEFKLCSNCGSTELIEDYPTPGTGICTECGHEITKVLLDTLSKDDVLTQGCEFCKKDQEQVETLYEDDYVLVRKCKNCGKLKGYKLTIEPFQESEYANDGDYSEKDIVKARTEGKNIVNQLPASKRKEIAKLLKQVERDPRRKCKKKLVWLFFQKTPQIKKMGIRKTIIGTAEIIAKGYLNEKGVLTDKQLCALICGSLTHAEDLAFRRRDITEHNATERALAGLFNVDRKTIRKWKKLLDQRERPPRYGIYIHQENGETKFGEIELPKDIQVVEELEKPCKGTCNLFGQETELMWRLKYLNGGWSDICQSAYEYFKKNYWQSRGTLNLP